MISLLFAAISVIRGQYNPFPLFASFRVFRGQKTPSFFASFRVSSGLSLFFGFWKFDNVPEAAYKRGVEVLLQVCCKDHQTVVRFDLLE